MSQDYTREFLTLAVVHFLAVVAPGPDFAVTVRQSVRFGRAVGMVTALGIGMGISLHVGYTLLGVGALLHTYPWLLTVASLLGATYLVYLGVLLLRSRPRASMASPSESLESKYPDGEVPSFSKAFLLGFLTNATNPKATLFFMAIFTTLVQTTTPLKVQHRGMLISSALPKKPPALKRLAAFFCLCRRAMAVSNPYETCV